MSVEVHMVSLGEDQNWHTKVLMIYIETVEEDKDAS